MRVETRPTITHCQQVNSVQRTHSMGPGRFMRKKYASRREWMRAVNIQGRNLRADNWVGKYLHRVNIKILIGCFLTFLSECLRSAYLLDPKK